MIKFARGTEYSSKVYRIYYLRFLCCISRALVLYNQMYSLQVLASAMKGGEAAFAKEGKKTQELTNTFLDDDAISCVSTQIFIVSARVIVTNMVIV